MEEEQRWQIVTHSNMDTEALLMVTALQTYPDLRVELGYPGGLNPFVKVVPSGSPLNPKWWPGIHCPLTTEALEQAGFIFVDVGGRGLLLDHHCQLTAGGQRQSGAEKLIEAALTWAMKHESLLPLFAVVDANDRNGEDTALQEPYLPQAPNIRPTFRSLISGWNLMYPDKPDMVLLLGEVACRGIMSALEQWIPRVRDELPEGPDHVQREADASERVVRELMGWRGLLPAVRDQWFEYVADGDETKRLTTWFEQNALRALEILQRDWNTAEVDYFGGDCHAQSVAVNPTQFGVTGPDHFQVVWGRSRARNFGAVCRRGNVGRQRPHPDKSARPKADVVIQFQEVVEGRGTRFVVSTRGKIQLTRVARALRKAELRKRFCCVRQSGNSWLVNGLAADQSSRLVEVLRESELTGRLHIMVAADHSIGIVCKNGIDGVAQIIARAVQSIVGRPVAIITDAVEAELSKSGINSIRIVVAIALADGRVMCEEVGIPVLYLAEYLTALGNGFFSNPDAPLCALSSAEVVEITIDTLRAPQACDKSPAD